MWRHLYGDTFRKYSQISKKYGKQSVVGVNHYGGLRASIFDKASGNVLPFRTFACVPFLLGKELKKLLADGRINKNGFCRHLIWLSVWHRMEWLLLLSLIWLQGEKIKDTDKCIVVLDSFTDGGDGYDAGLFQNQLKNLMIWIFWTDCCFIDYLRNLGELFLWKAPLPEVVIEKVR